MATEPADVLIVGAGASGGVVARRLAEAGFSVVCLEQGDWHDRSGVPRRRARLGARRCASSGRRARTSAACPRTTRSTRPTPTLAPDVLGGRRLDADLRRRLAADAAVGLPRPHARRRRRRLAAHLRGAAAVLRAERPRTSASPGMGGDPAYPPGGEDPPLPPLPIGAGGLKVARAHTRLGWHWWPEPNSILSAPLRRAAPVRPAGHLPAGLRRGRQGVDRPDPLAEGDRRRRAAHHRRPGPPPGDERRRAGRPARPGSTATAASTSSRPRSSSSPPTPSARRGCCSSRRRRPIPTASRTRPGSSGKRLMMHPFANVGGPVRRGPRELAGPVRLLHRVASSSTRPTSAAASSAAPSGAWPRRSARSTPPCPAGPATQTWGPDHHLHVKSHLGRGANWGLFGEDLPDEANHVDLSATLTDSSGIPAPEIHYRVSENSRRLLDFHIERASESLARPAPTPSRSTGSCATPAGTCSARRGWATTRRPRSLDRWNRAHDVPNLYVVDGSCFVTSAGVNPTSSICALALRAADHMVETRFDQRVPA